MKFSHLDSPILCNFHPPKVQSLSWWSPLLSSFVFSLDAFISVLAIKELKLIKHAGCIKIDKRHIFLWTFKRGMETFIDIVRKREA